MMRNLQKVLTLRAIRGVSQTLLKQSRTPIPKMSLPKTLVTLANAGGVYLQSQQIEDLDSELQKASEAGEKALVDLLNMLKDRITAVSLQYQKCLEQQMTIIKEAADEAVIVVVSETATDLADEAAELDARNEMWEEYKLITRELKVELDNLVIVANTVGRMLRLEAMKYVTENKRSLKLIESKFKELEVLLNQEAKKMKKLEKSLLDEKKKRKHIEQILDDVEIVTR